MNRLTICRAPLTPADKDAVRIRSDEFSRTIKNSPTALFFLIERFIERARIFHERGSSSALSGERYRRRVPLLRTTLASRQPSNKAARSRKGQSRRLARRSAGRRGIAEIRCRPDKWRALRSHLAPFYCARARRTRGPFYFPVAGPARGVVKFEAALGGTRA